MVRDAGIWRGICEKVCALETTNVCRARALEHNSAIDHQPYMAIIQNPVTRLWQTRFCNETGAGPFT